MNKRLIGLTLILLLAIAGLCWLFRPFMFWGVRGTPPEYLVLNHVALAVELFAQENHGQPPTTWQQIREHSNLDKHNLGSLINSPAFPIQAQYVFVTNGPIVPQKKKGKIVLIRVRPVTTSGWYKGRYMVCWNGQAATVLWMPEADVKKMLTQARITLSTPDEDEIRRAKGITR